MGKIRLRRARCNATSTGADLEPMVAWVTAGLTAPGWHEWFSNGSPCSYR